MLFFSPNIFFIIKNSLFTLSVYTTWMFFFSPKVCTMKSLTIWPLASSSFRLLSGFNKCILIFFQSYDWWLIRIINIYQQLLDDKSPSLKSLALTTLDKSKFLFIWLSILFYFYYLSIWLLVVLLDNPFFQITKYSI